jgi:hypothetical protein
VIGVSAAPVSPTISLVSSTEVPAIVQFRLNARQQRAHGAGAPSPDTHEESWQLWIGRGR